MIYFIFVITYGFVFVAGYFTSWLFNKTIELVTGRDWEDLDNESDVD